MLATMRPATALALRLGVGGAAVAFALVVAGGWYANLALSGTLPTGLGEDALVRLLRAIGWAELGLTGVVAVGVAAGAWLHRPFWARGLAPVVVGMLLHWGWWLLDRRIDVFATAELAAGDPALLGRLEARMWTALVVDAVALLALLVGGALLLWPRPTPKPGARRRADQAPARVPAH